VMAYQFRRLKQYESAGKA